jgi:hypothetical protein
MYSSAVSKQTPLRNMLGKPFFCVAASFFGRFSFSKGSNQICWVRCCPGTETERRFHHFR